MSNRNNFTVSILKILVMSGRHAEPNVQKQALKENCTPKYTLSPSTPIMFLLEVFEYHSTL